MTISDSEYSILAVDAYTDSNGLSLQGWDQIYQKSLGDGFFARAYERGTGTDVVVVIRGADSRVDFLSVGQAFLGIAPFQLTDALNFYDQVLRERPGALVTLGGHSLGGGLASMVAYLRHTSAVVMDPVPSSGPVLTT